MEIVTEGPEGKRLTEPPAQPYQYRRRDLVEADWRRFAGWCQVTVAEWRDPRWQRAHSIRSVRQLRDVIGTGLSPEFYADLAEDQKLHATMPLLLTPQVVNTIGPETGPADGAWYADRVRRYMLPAASDRHPEWPSHPLAARDSLHESAMWAVEGLIHRYPTKVLAELTSTCPQYCGHCTRMDLVGTSTPQVMKYRFAMRSADRFSNMIEYLRRTPAVRDVVVSGGDVANVPWPRLQAFVGQLLEIESIRDIRLATKGLIGLPQHWLAREVRAGMAELASMASRRGVALAVHTHANAAQQLTPLVAEASRALLEAGVRDVRNQGVLLSGVNGATDDLLDLCFALLDGASIMPYYFYLCDIVPGAEHWRLSLGQAQVLQESVMGYLPGFATPRLVCDVPDVGKRWVHQVVGYDRDHGVSSWSKNYRTPADGTDPASLERLHHYYDPVHTLPEEGQLWWRSMRRERPDDSPRKGELVMGVEIAVNGTGSQRERAQVRKVYETIADEYDERIPGNGVVDEIFTESETAFLLGKVQSDDDVLDMGCGTGRFTIPLAERARSVAGLDMSPMMLLTARKKLADRGLEADLCEGDMADLPFPDASFDVVVSMLALMHIPRQDRQKVFHEVARVLRPGGRLLIGVKNSVFERMFRGDRFAAVDITDVESEELIFTGTRDGVNMVAPWHSFSPDELTSLSAVAGLCLVHLRGNSPISAWLADAVLADTGVRSAVRHVEHVLADIPPFSHLGYHLLAEAVKPGL
jgi:lysine 2,3-aminomutase